MFTKYELLHGWCTVGRIHTVLVQLVEFIGNIHVWKMQPYHLFEWSHGAVEQSCKKIWTKLNFCCKFSLTRQHLINCCFPIKSIKAHISGRWLNMNIVFFTFSSFQNCDKEKYNQPIRKYKLHVSEYYKPLLKHVNLSPAELPRSLFSYLKQHSPIEYFLQKAFQTP